MSVMGVPKTIDNDLPATDHRPEYASAARFAAVSTAGAGRDLKAMKTFDDEAIVEIMRRDAGWLAAASVLLQKEPEDTPHLVYLPERAFKMENFLEAIQAVHRELGYVFVAIGEGIRDATGEFIGSKNVVRGTLWPYYRSLGRRASCLSCPRGEKRIGVAGSL
jgi:ATP-dependent phosphofructokinase / diphosphate-dependent phosphofructokinase